MAYNGKYYKFKDFSGGVITACSLTDLKPNEAAGAQDIIIGPNGSYIRSRRGYAEGNATEFGSADGWPTQGVGAFLPTSGGESVLVVRKGKVYSSSFSNARQALSFSDITGAFAGIAAGATASDAIVYRKTTIITFNDLAIGFGGTFASPDTPFKWTGSGNIAALGGTPPSACKAFSVNNRVFAYGNSATNPQRISWSALGNAEDWTGTGSGSAEVGGLEDGEPLLAHAVLSNEIVLLFKKSRIYQMVVSEAPFPIQLFAAGVGVAAPDVVTVKDGIAYFLTSEARVSATGGDKIETLPNTVNNCLEYINSVNNYTSVVSGQRQRCFSFALQGHDFDWVVWVFSSTTANLSPMLIWDVSNQCWIGPINSSAPTGIVDTVPTNYTPFNCGATFSDGTFWGGSTTEGVLYQFDHIEQETDDNTASAVTGTWRTGWITLESPETVIQARKILFENDAFDGETVSFGVYFDFNPTAAVTSTPSISPVLSPAEALVARQFMVTGRGNYIQIRLSITPGSGKFYGFTVAGKTYGQKKSTVD